MPWLLDDNGKNFVRALVKREIRIDGFIRSRRRPVGAEDGQGGARPGAPDAHPVGQLVSAATLPARTIGVVRSPSPRGATRRGATWCRSCTSTPSWRAGLEGIEEFSHVLVVYWMHQSSVRRGDATWCGGRAGAPTCRSSASSRSGPSTGRTRSADHGGDVVGRKGAVLRGARPRRHRRHAARRPQALLPAVRSRRPSRASPSGPSGSCDDYF